MVNPTTMLSPACVRSRWRVAQRAVILLLLLAIPTLSTLAKTRWYLPQADAGHYLTGAVKMKVAHSPIVFEGLPPQTDVRIAPPQQPAIRVTRPIEPAPEIPSISVRVSLQHRSPPFFLN